MANALPAADTEKTATIRHETATEARGKMHINYKTLTAPNHHVRQQGTSGNTETFPNSACQNGAGRRTEAAPHGWFRRSVMPRFGLSVNSAATDRRNDLWISVSFHFGLGKLQLGGG